MPDPAVKISYRKPCPPPPPVPASLYLEQQTRLSSGRLRSWLGSPVFPTVYENKADSYDNCGGAARGKCLMIGVTTDFSITSPYDFSI